MTKAQAQKQVDDYNKQRAAALHRLEETFGKDAVIPLQVAVAFLPQVPKAMQGYPIKG